MTTTDDTIQPLQEIYGDNRKSDPIGQPIKTLKDIISELKEKYGDDWEEHLSETVAKI